MFRFVSKKGKILRYTTAPLSVLFLLSFGVSGLVRADTCRAVLGSLQVKVEVESGVSELESAPLSVSYFLDRVKELYPSKHLHPKFMDSDYEQKLVPLWKGTTKAPLAIRQTLLAKQKTNTGHHYTALIDHQLLAADQGVVKTATPGNFLSLRWNENWRGRNMSTNMGVFAPSLLEASLRPEYPYLVSSDAKAVFLFLHGGGTATTGHHVAASITNYMGHRGVAVISIDSPHHAYGPREDLSPEEYYRYLKDLRYKIAPEEVPVFVGGHSMGGEHADNLMRLSKKHGVGEAFAGFISLSAPMDEAPGESLERKEEVKDQLLANEEIFEFVPESEKNLNVTLFLQGKIAQLSSISTNYFSTLLEWSIPEHKGSSWKPALYLMGRYDALYMGREGIFDEYVTALENTEVHIMDDRIDHNGNEVRIGHMIFDHQMPGDFEAPESFTRIKDFISRVIGQELTGEHVGRYGLMTHILLEYYNNLAFRIFLAEHKYSISRGQEPLTSYGKRSGEIAKGIKEIKKKLKKLNNSSQASDDLEEVKGELEVKLEKLEAELVIIRSYQRKTYVPAKGDEHREFAIENLAKREEISGQLEIAFSKRHLSEDAMKEQKDPIARLTKGLENLVTQSLHAEEAELPEPLKPVRAKLEDYIAEIVEFYKKVSEENDKYAFAEISANSFQMNPPEELKVKYQKLAQMYQRYIQMQEKAKDFVKRLIAQGVYGEEAKKQVIKLYGSEEALITGELLPDSLLGKDERLRKDFEGLSVEISRLEFIKDKLEEEYVRVVLPNFYLFRITSGYLELDKKLGDVTDGGFTLQGVWGKWHGQNGIWKTRPSDTQTSLY